MRTGDRTVDKNGNQVVWIDRNDSPGAPMIPEQETNGKVINGKYYPMWQQFVDKKAEWIGGPMEDLEDGERDLLRTQITDITLTPNGTDSAYFCIHGKNFDCAFDVKHGGIMAGKEGWLTFHRQYLGEFRIRRKGE